MSDHCNLLMRTNLAEKIQALVQKLVQHKHQTVKGPDNMAASETHCEILMGYCLLEEVKQILVERVKEVEDLSGMWDVNQALETQIQGLKAVQQVMQQTTGKLKITNNNLWVWDKEILIHQSEIMELKAEKAELQAFLSKAQDAAKLMGEATRRAEEGYLEESRKLYASVNFSIHS
ncbi:hypothetical protein L208DRAFT_1374355 [Tricholoma matsutake]|nr:hypothetical protein L208DRAFT_1374355 [Tricholoma matsutake 945]